LKVELPKVLIEQEVQVFMLYWSKIFLMGHS